MKKQTKSISMLMHIWEDYEFSLYIPKELTGFNKPHISFYYLDLNTNKRERIKKFLKKHNGDIPKIKEQAKSLITDLIQLLSNNWNPITNKYNETSISPLSSIKDCINYYCQAQDKAFTNLVIGKKRLENIKRLLSYFEEFLTQKGLLNTKLNSLTNIHIKEFLDSYQVNRHWGKVTYNTYLIDMRTFFNYMVDFRIINHNPTKRIEKKNTRFDSSRFKIYEEIELKTVSHLLSTDPRYRGLYLASKIVFKYNIRPIEITRIQVSNIDFNKKTLTLPSSKTKNGNEAIFKLDLEIELLLKELISGASNDHYIFGGRNKPSLEQVCPDYFGQNWRQFRKKHNLPDSLKFYALKHSSNYYDLKGGASFEEIRQRNRHANLQVTSLYVKNRLLKGVIMSSSLDIF